MAFLSFFLRSSFLRTSVLLALVFFTACLTAQPMGGLAFDGVNDHVVLAPQIAKTLSNQRKLTLEVRVSFNALQSYRGIFAFRDYRGYYNSNIFELQTAGGGGNKFATNISAGREDFRTAEGTTIRIGQEYLVSVVFDGTQVNPRDRTKMYIDGVRQQLSGGNYAPSATPNLNIETPVYLAREGRQYSAITIRELRIWNTARSAEEVAANQSSTLTGNLPEGLTAYYDFQRSQGKQQSISTLVERTGSGNNGRLRNFSYSGTNSNWVTTSQAVLPVKLVTFEVNAAGMTDNRLEWKSASEVGFSHYTVERSTDGFSNWQKLGEVGPASAEEGELKQYAFVDLLAPARAYYRLQLVDLDGTLTYSDIVLQERALGEDAVMAVYPNPTNGPITLELATEEAVSLTITDMSGRRVWQQELPSGAAGRASLNPGLAPGVYMLTARSGSGNWTKRLVVR